MSKRDLYEVLGVSQSASQDEIRKVYKKLARKFHPDVKPAVPDAEKKFSEITEAYDVLGDEEKRKNFDQFGHGFHGGGGAPGDLLVTIQIAPHPWCRRDGSNLLVDVPLTPSEAALGAKIDVPTLTEGLIVLKIVLPKELSEEARSLYQQLSELPTADPRDGMWT